MWQSSVCFLCVKSFNKENTEKTKASKLKLNTAGTTFALFCERFLKLPPESPLISSLCSKGQQNENQSSSRTSSSSSLFLEQFCSDCLEILGGTFQLYNQLCELQLKMAWRLGQWEALLKEDETLEPSSQSSSLPHQNLSEQLQRDLGLGGGGEEVLKMRNLLLSHCKKARNQMEHRKLEVSLDRCSVPVPVPVATQGKISNFDDCETKTTSLLVLNSNPSLSNDDDEDVDMVVKRESDGQKFEYANHSLAISDDEASDDRNWSDHAVDDLDDDDDEESEVEANAIKQMDIDEEDVNDHVQMKAKEKAKRRRRVRATSKWKLERGRGFRKTLISKLLNSNGITKNNFGGISNSKPDLTTVKINEALTAVLKSFPMNYDPSSDTISVGGVAVLVNEKEGSLKCSECSLKFYHGAQGKQKRHGAPSGSVDFQMHDHILRRHLEGFKFECPICSSSQITTFRGFEDHLKMHFAAFPCDICGKPFGAQKDMRRHKLTHLSRSERSETVASAQGSGGMQTFIFGAIMKASKLEKFPEKVRSIISDVAGDQTMSEWKRKLLLRVIRNTSTKIHHPHENLPHAKFPLVYHHETGKLAVSNPSKETEIEIIFVQGQESLECSLCSERFEGRHTAEYHIQNHILGVHLDAFKCPFCKNKIFESYTSYNTHVTNAHDSGPPPICEICGKTFKNSHTLHHHKNKIHKKVRKVKPKSKVRTMSPSQKKLQCSTCGQTFAQPNHLRRHERTHLTPDQMEYHACSFCGRKYSSVYHRNRHTKVSCAKNPNIQRVPCKYCEKTFRNSEQLRKHVFTLHPEKADEQFGERQFQCEKCPGRFATQWSLDYHFAARHADKGAGAEAGASSSFTCRKKCGKVLPSEHGMKVHESYCDGTGCKTDRK